MRKMLLSVPLVVGVAAGSIACVTQGYVNQGIAEVNEKVETLSEALEETQEQTRQNAEGVAEAQERAQAAGRSAAQAGSAAAAADAKAEAAGRDTERLMRLLYEVVLSEEQSNFGFGQSQLPEGARAVATGPQDRVPRR